MPSYSGAWSLPAQMQAKASLQWPQGPGAPTSVSATAGTNEATVTFVAPTFTGVPPGITGYLATSSPGGFTATGASSPLTVTGLTGGTAYTFDVQATNAVGYGAAGTSNSVSPVVPPTVIGQAFGGGFYAGKIVDSGVTYFIIVAPKSSGEVSSIAYKTDSSAGPSATQTLNSGPDASSSMNSATYPAAQFCEGLSIGGYTDWYLPSRDELELCYRNLKPTTTSNNTDLRTLDTSQENPDVEGDTMGVNRNSSPVGSAYTSGTPSQTSAIIFRTGNSEAFINDLYWTSSQNSGNATFAWRQNFDAGWQAGYLKSILYAARAIRRVPV